MPVVVRVGLLVVRRHAALIVGHLLKQPAVKIGLLEHAKELAMV